MCGRRQAADSITNLLRDEAIPREERQNRASMQDWMVRGGDEMVNKVEDDWREQRSFTEE